MSWGFGNAASKGKGNAASKGKGNKDEQDKRVGRIRKPPVSHTVQTYSLIFFLDILTYLVFLPASLIMHVPISELHAQYGTDVYTSACV
jgi:hypothetical protein